MFTKLLIKWSSTAAKETTKFNWAWNLNFYETFETGFQRSKTSLPKNIPTSLKVLAAWGFLCQFHLIILRVFLCCLLHFESLMAVVFTPVPPNGLVSYCGTIVTDDGKEKKVNIDFEPFRPINTSLYLCDNKFHTEVTTACCNAGSYNINNNHLFYSD